MDDESSRATWNNGCAYACFADGLPVVKGPLYEMTLGVSACRQTFPHFFQKYPYTTPL